MLRSNFIRTARVITNLLQSPITFNQYVYYTIALFVQLHLILRLRLRLSQIFLQYTNLYIFPVIMCLYIILVIISNSLKFGNYMVLYIIKHTVELLLKDTSLQRTPHYKGHFSCPILILY